MFCFFLNIKMYIEAPADKQSQLCCVDYHRQPLVGTGSAGDTKTLAEAIA